MAINESGTKILLDGSDPAETKEIRGLLGRIDRNLEKLAGANRMGWSDNRDCDLFKR